MYRTIDTAIWTDPRVKGLSTDGKLLFVYLITNSHAHVSGIFYLPLVTVSHETGLPRRTLDTLCDTLSELGLVRIDRDGEVFWVVNMFRHQGHGVKTAIAASHQLCTLHNSVLCKEFATKYPVVLTVTNGYRIDTVSDRVSAAVLSKQEQEQEQEQNTTASAVRPEPLGADSGPPPPPDPIVFEFPCKGRTPFWHLLASKVAELQTTFPAVDVPVECRLAHGWALANEAKRKTARGMAAFLYRWMEKRQNRDQPLLGKPQASRPAFDPSKLTEPVQ